MAIRTTPAEVQQATPISCEGVNLHPYIRKASLLVNQIETADTENLLDADTLKELETLLAAHFYQHLMDQQEKSKNTGRAGATFHGETGKYFEATFPGQSALELDATGYLSKKQGELVSGMNKKARLLWLGTPTDSTRPDQQQDVG